MTTNRILATLAATCALVSAAVPGSINYQGRLTNAEGVPQAGEKAMSVKIHDAATAGTLLYTESLGTVTVDANGIYAFQFGTAGNSQSLYSETLATTDGTATVYQKTLAHTPLAGTLMVADGTFGWNETTGNPGAPATATATVMAGFVIGGTVTNGGSGYTDPPAVTITGNGTGATATATVSGGSVTAINIVSAGSGYTNGATISIAAPPAPFTVNYANNTVTATYSPAAPAGRAIIATYRYSASGISGALAAGADQWLELTIDGVPQTPRQKILAVPFAMRAESAENAVGALAAQINGLSDDLAKVAGGIPNDTIFSQSFGVSKSSVIAAETTLMDKGNAFAPISEQYQISANSVTFNFSNAFVRGLTCGFEYDTKPGKITYTYNDNSSQAIDLTLGGSQYVENPNPSKPVTRVVVESKLYDAGWRVYATVRLNQSGALSLSIPSTLRPKSKIGLFINKSIVGPGDQVSAVLVGSSGSQPIAIDSYTKIENATGVPQKIIVSVSAPNTNLAAYSSIFGFIVRYSD